MTAWLVKWAAIIGSVLLAIVTFGLYSRRKGVESMQVKVDTAEAANKQLESRHETDLAVERLPDAKPGVAIGDAPADTSAGKLSSWADEGGK